MHLCTNKCSEFFIIKKWQMENWIIQTFIWFCRNNYSILKQPVCLVWSRIIKCKTMSCWLRPYKLKNIFRNMWSHSFSLCVISVNITESPYGCLMLQMLQMFLPTVSFVCPQHPKVLPEQHQHFLHCWVSCCSELTWGHWHSLAACRPDYIIDTCAKTYTENIHWTLFLFSWMFCLLMDFL